MFKENNIKIQINYEKKKNYCMQETVEMEVIKALQKEGIKLEYTLNTVNSYGENLLHISAANDCLDIIKEIFRKYECREIINRKNKFGWTPLMLAIRNRNIKTVKYLLQQNANINESTYLGMSVFGLAAAINKDMFDIVYEACPSALLNTLNDDITPLCIAAMKNDKNLFFKLIELGFDVSKSNEYTYIMMKQSTIPEIKNFAKDLDIEEYWNNNSDNIFIEDETDIAASNTNYCIKNIDKNLQNLLKLPPLNLTNHLETDQCALISPTLTCTFNEILPTSPNIYFTQNKYIDEIKINTMHNTVDNQIISNKNEIVSTCLKNKTINELSLQRLQSIRPPDLDIQNEEEDLNTTLGYVPEFSPLRSPNVPSSINDENVFGEDTPTPPRYKTPPRGMILNSEEAKMFVLLKHYGLNQHVSIFLQQEIDVDLFVTLTNEDLIEIGIENEVDRKTILNVIADYKKSMV
ncbi:uncharacterized protein LOC100863110 isoform X1 [Apis florea]|uniref:uncharacterized protein LOC100863110 isoform X1 n=2 Tax=Apis florea TaxID=7463 RepID=UPI0012FF256E|nr:uncharacterized protein LOC100863110 isoform X1 [Apis florea]